MSAGLTRAVLNFVLVALAVYGAVLVYVYFMQARLIYFPNVPGRSLTATPAAIGLRFEEVQLETRDGVLLHGWFVPGTANAGTVLFCHGNAGNISHRLEWLAILHKLGLSVLLFDYRGYGRSEGAPDEAGTYEDARAAWSYLTNERGVSPGEIVVFGESLGGAVAAHLAKEVEPRALITISAFSSVPDLAADIYWFLPVRLLARFRYATADYVAQVPAPVLLIHSRDDEIVPYSHAKAIFARAREPKDLLEIRGDHNTGFLDSADEITAAIGEFLRRHPPRPAVSGHQEHGR